MGAGRNTDNRSGKEGRSEIERYKKDLHQSRGRAGIMWRRKPEQTCPPPFQSMCESDNQRTLTQHDITGRITRVCLSVRA